MQLSARNQLNATVETVTHGEVMSIQVHRLVAWSDDSIKEV